MWRVIAATVRIHTTRRRNKKISYNQSMRKLFSWIMLVVSLCVACYMWQAHKAQYRAITRVAIRKISPCTSPLMYSIGSIDPRFNISREAFAAAITQASAVWEFAANKSLFQYAPSGGDVTINLVYDERQASLDKLKALGMETGQNTDSYNALKARYDVLSVQSFAEEARLHSMLTSFSRAKEAYAADIRRWNRSSSFHTPGGYRNLEHRRGELEREYSVIKPLIDKSNSHLDILNALATTLNQLILRLNLSIAQYNRTGSSIGVYEEGVYQIFGGIQTINLYSYNDHTQLVRLIAHEMGHSLGLEHVSDSQAIMYPVNQCDNLSATGADMSELNKACTSCLRNGRLLRDIRERIDGHISQVKRFFKKCLGH